MYKFPKNIINKIKSDVERYIFPAVFPKYLKISSLIIPQIKKTTKAFISLSPYHKYTKSSEAQL